MMSSVVDVAHVIFPVVLTHRTLSMLGMRMRSDLSGIRYAIRQRSSPGERSVASSDVILVVLCDPFPMCSAEKANAEFP
jgi:hypothetical protein